jgi:transcriptional regulator with XRE-family HTH domain
VVADVVISRIGETLRAARRRAGWSREALAYHSGVSWSAISQIESGRRKDVRLGSLLALSDALGVSVDYLIGTKAAISPQLFEHRVLAYGSDEDFLGGSIPFLTEGIEQSHCLLAITTKAKTALLRDALDERSEHVEFADWADWYSSPLDALNRYGAFVTEKFGAGAIWIRVVAEAAWTSTDDDIAEWTRYESLVNLSFASSPATIICTYDERSFPENVVTDARRTHPEVVRGSEVSESPTYEEAERFLMEPSASR